jgi:hypothetical protein
MLVDERECGVVGLFRLAVAVNGVNPLQVFVLIALPRFFHGRNPSILRTIFTLPPGVAVTGSTIDAPAIMTDANPAKTPDIASALTLGMAFLLLC